MSSVLTFTSEFQMASKDLYYFQAIGRAVDRDSTDRL